MATKKISKKSTKNNKKSVRKETIKKPIKKSTKKSIKKSTKKISNKKVNIATVNLAKKNIKNKTLEEVNKSFIALVVVVVIIVLIAVIVAIVSTRPKNYTINSIEDINSSLNMNIKTPLDASGVSYEIENGNVAKVTYKKKGYDGMEIEFVMRSASSKEEINLEDEHEWGTLIMMVTKCKDGSDIEVTSCLATDVENVMKGEWFDNDLYYKMTTESLTTREDFLQEINRVIKENHIEF